MKTNIRGRDQGSFAKELNKKIDDQVRLPENYSFSLGGQFENLKRSRDRLLLVIPVTLFLIFSILLVFFRYQFRYAMMVMTNIPLAVVGGIAALYLRRINISISAGVGFVSLAGVCVMTGVLWVNYLNKLENKKHAVFCEAIVKGSLVQFRPVFIILAIAIIGLLPAALNTGVGSDVQRPLATVIVGGLMTTLLFSPIFLPVLYYWIERRKCDKVAESSK